MNERANEFLLDGVPVREPSMAVSSRAMSTQLASHPPAATTIGELPPGTGCSEGSM